MYFDVIYHDVDITRSYRSASILKWKPLRFYVWSVRRWRYRVFRVRCVQFAGRWYRVGLAYNSPSFARHRNKLTICMGVVEPTENGDAVMTVWQTKWVLTNHSKCLNVNPLQHERCLSLVCRRRVCGRSLILGTPVLC